MVGAEVSTSVNFLSFPREDGRDDGDGLLFFKNAFLGQMFYFLFQFLQIKRHNTESFDIQIPTSFNLKIIYSFAQKIIYN
jgi:hypothetical protein